MKGLLITIFCLQGAATFADGPSLSVSRRHATSLFTFDGATKLGNYILTYNHYGFFKKDSLFEGYQKISRQINTEPYVIETKEGGRRWEEEDRKIYISVIDTLKGITTDSLYYFAKDYNINFTINGVSNGKLQFTADSTKAIYDYRIFGNEDNPAAHKRSRIILIAISVLGILLLAWLYTRNKNSNHKTA
jgi:hypothetical protein